MPVRPKRSPAVRTRSVSLESALQRAHPWKGKDFLGTRDLTPREILSVLDLAAALKNLSPGEVSGALRGRRLFNFFFESSTRTKTSFALAARGLGCEVVDFSPSASSLSKGESLIDTARTIESMGIDFAVIRHPASGAPRFLASRIHAHVLNAGDGANEHPTQALLDLLTMKEALGKVEGLHVVLVGDIAHSRVARSNIWALRALGNQVTVVGPATLVPRVLEESGVSVSHDFDEALGQADAVMMLRLQMERQGEHLIPSAGEYTHLFGLTRARFAAMKKNAIVMHPGPMNRGLEICSEAADSDRSVILDQVQNGIYVRMAVLMMLSGKKKETR